MATVLTGRPVLALYRELLKAAITSPTKKRDSIVKEIQNGFRESRGETDPKKLEALFAESFAALKEMRRYDVIRNSTGTEIKFNLHH